MRLKVLNDRLKDFSQQRNLLMSFVVLLALLSVIQAMALIFKSDHVVIIPPEVSQRFWIERNRASKAYLEEMGMFFANLVLDSSPSSSAYQREVLLRYALPEAYSNLKSQLMEDEQRLKKENLSTSFKPISVKVNRRLNLVELTGDLLGYVGNKRISQSRDTYLMKLEFQKGRIFIVSFKLKESHG